MAVFPATNRHVTLREQVRAFAEKEIRPRVQCMEENPHAVDYELAKLIARQGWTSPTYDPKYGGLGIGHLGKTIILEELARESGAAAAIAQAGIIPTGAIVHFGSEEQKLIWLRAIAGGECLPAIDVTEPESGGDILAMQSTGEFVGDGYVLNGHKAHIGNSHVATVHLVVVRTGPHRTKGLTAFLVEADRPGLEVGPHVPMIGLRGFSCGEVTLTNCRVPVANRVGEEGQGLLVAHTASILYGRPNLAALGLGLQQATADAAAALLVENERLKAQQIVRQRVGAIRQRLKTSRTVLYDAVDRLDNGLPCDEELIAAKFENTEAAEESTRDVIKAYGADGLYVNQPLERYSRDAHCIWPPAGTSDVQLYRLSQIPSETRKQLSEIFAAPTNTETFPAISPDRTHAGEFAASARQPSP